MTLTELLEQLKWLVFAEDDEDEEEESEEESEDEEEEESEDDDEDEEEEGEKPKKKASKKTKPDPRDEELKRVREALRKERLDRRKLSKEVRGLRKAAPATKAAGTKKSKDEEDEKNSESKAELEQERQRNERLAAKLATQAVDQVILRLAPGLKFKDADDAMSQIKRSEDWYDQDEDDPSVIDVDEDEVRDALKALARRKPYLLAEEPKKRKGDEEEEDDDEEDETSSRTGSKFSGKTRKTKSANEEKLREKYSALANTRR